MTEMLLTAGIVLGIIMSTFVLRNWEELAVENVELLLDDNYSFNSKYGFYIDEEKIEDWEEDYSEVFSDQNGESQQEMGLMVIDADEKLIKGGLVEN